MWPFKKEKIKETVFPNTSLIIGDWKSDIIETRKTGYTHYKVNNIKGLQTMIDMMSEGRGSGTISWWIPGLHFKLECYIPLEILVGLNKK